MFFMWNPSNSNTQDGTSRLNYFPKFPFLPAHQLLTQVAAHLGLPQSRTERREILEKLREFSVSAVQNGYFLPPSFQGGTYS